MFTSPSPPQLKPHGDVIRKAGPPPHHHHHFFLSFFLFFLVSCPSSLRSFLFDEVVGVQRDAARLGYRLSTKHHGKSKLWLIRRAGRLVCLHVLRRLPPPDPCVLILGGAVIPGRLKTSKVRNGKLKPFTDMFAHARSLLSSPHVNQDVCSKKKKEKTTEACQTSGGPTNP